MAGYDCVSVKSVDAGAVGWCIKRSQCIGDGHGRV